MTMTQKYITSGHSGGGRRLVDLTTKAGRAMADADIDQEFLDKHGVTYREYYDRLGWTAAPADDSDVAPRTSTGTGVANPVASARHAEAIAYVAAYTGTWGLPLDIRADSRWGTKWLHLTDRQVDALLTGKARDAQRAEAAQIAREIAADDQYRAWVARPAQPVQQAQAWRPAARVDADGMYKTADGTIWKVQRAVNGSGNLYAKRLVVDEASRTGSFEYAPGAITRLTAADKMSLEDAQAFGRLYGVCCVCGRTLTDESSIAAGIGPICSGRGFGI
jgi:hypothetical protein